MIDTILITSAEDILAISSSAKKLGWYALAENSFQRIVYLLKVLYSFNHEGDNLFNCYHFNVTTFGPYSVLVKKGLVFLISSGRLKEDETGNLEKNTQERLEIGSEKMKWIDTILQILGRYGEEKIFAFISNDPLYVESVKSNRVAKEINMSDENKTLQILNDFKLSFEQTLDDTSSISAEEYISMYFDYIFSEIIKR